MGCTGSRTTIIKSNDRNKQLKINDIKRKCITIFRKNVLFNNTKDSVDSIIILFKNEFGYNLNKLLEHLQLPAYLIELFSSIYANFISKLSGLIEDKIAKETILYLIILFLTNDKNIELQKRNVIKSLIELIRQEESFNTQKLVSLITCIVQLHEAVMLYLILLFVFLPFNKEDLDSLIVSKHSINSIDPLCLNAYVEQQLKDLNSEISEKAINLICISYAFDPIAKSK